MEHLGVLFNVLEALDQGRRLNKKEVVEALSVTYEEVVGKYRPILEAVPIVSGKISADIAPVLATALKILNDTAADKKLQAEISKFRKARAEGRMRSIKTYLAAGFTRDEAISLMLADIASMRDTIKSTSRGGTTSKK